MFRRFSIAAAALFLGSAAPLPSQTEPTPIRVHVDLVSVAVRVTDKQGHDIQGLAADDFTVKEAGQKQKMAFFDRKKEPISLHTGSAKNHGRDKIIRRMRERADHPVYRRPAGGAHPGQRVQQRIPGTGIVRGWEGVISKIDCGRGTLILSLGWDASGQKATARDRDNAPIRC
jgi:hypothetical protein